MIAQGQIKEILKGGSRANSLGPSYTNFKVIDIPMDLCLFLDPLLAQTCTLPVDGYTRYWGCMGSCVCCRARECNNMLSDL